MPDESVLAFCELQMMEVGNDDWFEIDPNDSRLLLQHPCRIVAMLSDASTTWRWMIAIIRSTNGVIMG